MKRKPLLWRLAHKKPPVSKFSGDAKYSVIPRPHWGRCFTRVTTLGHHDTTSARPLQAAEAESLVGGHRTA